MPSAKDVATYDEAPAMRAEAIVHRLAETVEASPPDLVVLNFANPDMVGHTGNMAATEEALETVDRCLGEALQVLEGWERRSL